MVVLRVPKAFWRILSVPPSSSLTCPEYTGPAFSVDLACRCLLISVTVRSAVLRKHLWLIIPGPVSKKAMNIGQWTRTGNGRITWGAVMWLGFTWHISDLKASIFLQACPEYLCHTSLWLQLTGTPSEYRSFFFSFGECRWEGKGSTLCKPLLIKILSLVLPWSDSLPDLQGFPTGRLPQSVSLSKFWG